jgi:hypothetical protein
MRMTEFLVPIAGKAPAEGQTEEDLLQTIQVPDATEKERQTIIDDVRKAVNEAFRDKIPAPWSQKPALIHLHGPAGSGKSWWTGKMYVKGLVEVIASFQKQRTFVWASYDENGIIEKLQGWQSECPNPAVSFDPEQYIERLRVRNKFRHASWVGRDLVLNRVLTDYYSAIVDTVGHNHEILKLMDLARNHNIENRTVAFYAPYRISKERVLMRRRAIDIEEELIGKRIGALQMFSAIVESVQTHRESLSLIHNPDNENPPVLALRIEKGTVEYRDEMQIEQIIQEACEDLTHPDLMQWQKDLLKSTKGYVDTLEELAAGPDPEPSPPEPV